MKSKLLKKLRNRGRNQINIYSTTTTNGVVTGMSIGYSGKNYSGLFSFGNTEEQVLNKACKKYLCENLDEIRQRYRKYSVKFKK